MFQDLVATLRDATCKTFNECYSSTASMFKVLGEENLPLDASIEHFEIPQTIRSRILVQIQPSIGITAECEESTQWTTLDESVLTVEQIGEMKAELEDIESTLDDSYHHYNHEKDFEAEQELAQLRQKMTDLTQSLQEEKANLFCLLGTTTNAMRS